MIWSPKFFFAVTSPLLFLGLMHMLERFVEHADRRQRLTKVGWDCCVLALGLIGHVFADPSLGRVFAKADTAQVAQVSSFIAVLVCALGIASMRKTAVDRDGGKLTGYQAVWSMTLGAVAVAIPSYFYAMAVSLE